MYTHRTLTKDSMMLYQHSTQCSYAMQWFLDENPEYWPFIPQKNNTSSDATSICFNYADDDVVPRPSADYHFTYQQKIEMEQFFYEKKYLGSPNLHLDLYQAAIIAVCKFVCFVN